MSRFYSRVSGLRHRLAGIAPPLLVMLALACGSSAPAARDPVATDSIQALLQQAEDAERARDYHRARALYQRAIDESPDAASAALANRDMASALIFWGEYEGGRDRLVQSLEHDNSQARVWHDLGMVQDHLEQPEEALVSLAKAVELAPKEPRARIAYAALLVKQAQYAAAILEYESLLELSIPPRIEAAAHKALDMLRAEIKRGN